MLRLPAGRDHCQDGPPGDAARAAAFMEDVRQSMLQGVEEDLAEHLRAVWKRGADATQAVQNEGNQSFDSLVECLSEVRGAQQSLEAENERLRQVITTMAARLSQLGPAAFQSPSAGSWASSPAVSAGSGPGRSPQAGLPTPPTFFMPGTFPPSLGERSTAQPVGAIEELWRATGGHDLSPHVATLPAFPFEPQLKRPPGRQQAPPPLGAKVSLADVLGICDPAAPSSETPSTARSAAGSESSTAWSSGSDEVDAFVFGLTLRLADGAELGLTTSQAGRDRHLRIEGVLPGGAAEAWNRQCGSSGAAEKVLLPGDKIVSVNDVAADPQAMLVECGSRRLLRFQIVRTGCSAPPSPREAVAARVDAQASGAVPCHRAAAERRFAGCQTAKGSWRL
mmetsp:Transcript_107592/g.335491  ORF Transcript_107592/g.335491 Transcript_107592/m.335491 type:complete len:394 (-) Transcript_107592:94-1275(-)